jgi:hypothetical protein
MAARKIADLSYEFASPSVKKEPWLGDRRDEGVNPFYNQTETGLFLEMYYGIPGKIWTPWGCWGCWGSGTGWDKKMTEAFLERLGATMYQQERYVEGACGGVIGPVYAVHRVDDMLLPDPVVRNRKKYLSYEQAKEEWGRLTRYYHDLLGTTVPATCSEKFAADDMILEIRAKNEPKKTESDIRSLDGIKSFGRGTTVKYTRDNGKTWHYGRFSGPCHIDNEVMANTEVHSCWTLSKSDFENGLIMRPATEEETRGILFSYDFKEMEKRGYYDK